MPLKSSEERDKKERKNERELKRKSDNYKNELLQLTETISN